MPAAKVILPALLAICFAIATYLEPRQAGWLGDRARGASVLDTLLGDGRRLFANHFFVKADVYFHSGYYPSIFDQAIPERSGHLASESGLSSTPGAPNDEHAHEHSAHEEAEEKEHEKAMDFLGRPKDWIDRFGRHFFSSEHSHLEHAEDTREMLPWLEFAAELDPHRVETYTVTSYWLSTRLNKVKEAEDFLRQGWRANPDSYAIILELGRLYEMHKNDPVRARNLYELALHKWEEQSRRNQHPDDFAYEQMVAHLAQVEDKLGNIPRSIEFLEKLEKVSPYPKEVHKQIEEKRALLQKK